jgi:hypothetical protein
MLRKNSRLKRFLGVHGFDLVQHAIGAFRRILPHVQVSSWTQGKWMTPESVYTSPERTEIRVTFAVGSSKSATSGSITATIERQSIPVVDAAARQTLDNREHDICRRIALHISNITHQLSTVPGDASAQPIRNAFDEFVVAAHIKEHHKLELSVSEILSALHTLSEQSYENKALTFGAILDPGVRGIQLDAQFPSDFFRVKKYKALSDGFRSAYHVSTDGKIIDFVDLESFEKRSLTEKHYYPDWVEPLARASRSGRCGIALSRQGDILIFDEGTLRFTYRFGKWQYWNHTHLLGLLRDRAIAQKVPRQILGRVVGTIYRAALDVSFRRSGGLFVILHNRKDLREIVRVGDAVGDQNRREETDRQFDAVLEEHTIQSLPRSVVVELASLDGAIVVENSGKIRAFGAVLQPRKTGVLRGTEGSRTKAAIGASNYGLAIKVSSDGEITIYHNGSEFIRV